MTENKKLPLVDFLERYNQLTSLFESTNKNACRIAEAQSIDYFEERIELLKNQFPMDETDQQRLDLLQQELDQILPKIGTGRAEERASVLMFEISEIESAYEDKLIDEQIKLQNIYQ